MTADRIEPEMDLFGESRHSIESEPFRFDEDDGFADERSEVDSLFAAEDDDIEDDDIEDDEFDDDEFDDDDEDEDEEDDLDDSDDDIDF